MEGRPKQLKKNPGSIYKNVPQHINNGSKNKRKSNLSGTSFFNNIETPSARKISAYGILASEFPSSYFIGTNALINYLSSSLKRAGLFHL